MARHEFAMWQHQVSRDWDGRHWIPKYESARVRVMARAEGYAMVRKPGCMPHVVSEKDLLPGAGRKG